MKSRQFLNELEAHGYKVCKVLNRGRSGDVYECVTGKRKKSVVIKIPHNDHNNNGEAHILRHLKDESNMVKCLGEIIHGDSEILVFEKLDVNLENYIHQSRCMPLTFIRDAVKQMGSALSALRRAGIIHTDIKPSHIMTDKQNHMSFQIKLIDFGSALSTSDAKQGSTLGTIGFMSPEIMLGLPFTQATDVWSLGCVVAYMMLGNPLFSTQSEYKAFKGIHQIIGQPSDELLDKGLYTSKFYKKCYNKWSPVEAMDPVEARDLDERLTSLDDLKTMNLRPFKRLDLAPREQCVDLLKKMLQIIPEDRITPDEIKKHPFITGRYQRKSSWRRFMPFKKNNKVSPLEPEKQLPQSPLNTPPSEKPLIRKVSRVSGTTAKLVSPFSKGNKILPFNPLRISQKDSVSGLVQRPAEQLRMHNKKILREERPDQVDLQGACSGCHRTCALINSPLPCVNSAIQHIQTLREKVEKWFQQPGKCHPQMELDKPPYADTGSVMSTEMVIEGIGLTPRKRSSVPPLLNKINDVLSEAMYLIEHLEADRQYVKENLLVEKKRTHFLESKFDRISLWMQQEHSFVVQKEHEACLRDISELKWQLKLEKDKLEQLGDKLAQSEMKKQHLREDINFSVEQIPIVKDNMNFQRSLINKINAEQKEADKLCFVKRALLAKVEKDVSDTKLFVENERRPMEYELQSLSNQLANRKEKLEQLMSVQKATDAELQEAKQSLGQTKDTFATTWSNITQLSEVEKAYKDEILKIKTVTKEDMKKNGMLKMKISSLQKDIETTRLNGEAEVSRSEEQLFSVGLREENLENEDKVEYYKNNITESKDAVKQMREERKQMLQKIIDTDEQWERAKEEVTLVVAQHSGALGRLEEQEKLTFMEEEKARGLHEGLRRDLTAQVTALEKLKAECANIKDKIYHHPRAAETTNLKFVKDFEKASSAMKSLQTSNEKMKALTSQLEDFEREHRRTLDNLNREKIVKQGQLQAAKDIHAATINRYDSTVDRIGELTKQSTDLQQASERAERDSESMPVVVEELESVFAMVDLKNKSAAFIMNTLQSDINNCLQRTQRSTQVHTAQVTASKRQMEDTQEALKAALSENKQLAGTYKHLTEALLETRQEAALAQTEKNSAQADLLYYTQLSLLQKRMHNALEKYYDQRSIYSQAELDQCQALSRETDQIMKTAQEWPATEIHAISAFLQSLTDVSTSTDEVQVDKQASSDATAPNK